MLLLVKLFVTSSVLLVLASCAETIPPPTTKFVKPNIQVQPRPRPLSLKNVEFYVVTADNYDEFVKRFEDKNGALVFVAISVEDYEALALNLADLKRYLSQQDSLLVYYERAVAEPSE